MFKGWIPSIPNVRYPKVGPRQFEVVRVPSSCGAGWLDPDDIRIARGVVHETQTKGIPGYSGSAPTVTAGPKLSGRWVLAQHMEVGRAACALRHPSGTPETNRVARIQIEICGYTTRARHLPSISLEGVALLESFFEWCEANLDIPERYPYNPEAMATGLWATTSNPWRQSKIWETERGWHPHAAVDSNDHWDVGGLDVPALFKAEPTPQTKTTFGLVHVWREADEDHRSLEEIVAPKDTLAKVLKAANTIENRKRIRRALAQKGHIVRFARRLIPIT